MNVTIWLLVFATPFSHSIEPRHTPYATEESCMAAAASVSAGRTDGTRAYCVSRSVPCNVAIRDVGGWAAGAIAACPPPPPPKDDEKKKSVK